MRILRESIIMIALAVAVGSMLTRRMMLFVDPRYPRLEEAFTDMCTFYVEDKTFFDARSEANNDFITIQSFQFCRPHPMMLFSKAGYSCST